MKIKFCGKCGRELSEGSGFCRFCGWKVLQPEPEEIQSGVKPKNKLPLPVLIGAALLVIAGLILWQTVFKSAELMQPPLVTENGIFIADFGRDSRLYRLDLDGKSKTKLSDEYVKNMAFEDGWIYYSGISGLYKIRVRCGARLFAPYETKRILAELRGSV